jgi:hypothetical protein
MIPTNTGSKSDVTQVPQILLVQTSPQQDSVETGIGSGLDEKTRTVERGDRSNTSGDSARTPTSGDSDRTPTTGGSDSTPTVLGGSQPNIGTAGAVGPVGETDQRSGGVLKVDERGGGVSAVSTPGSGTIGSPPGGTQLPVNVGGDTTSGETGRYQTPNEIDIFFFGIALSMFLCAIFLLRYSSAIQKWTLGEDNSAPASTSGNATIIIFGLVYVPMFVSYHSQISDNNCWYVYNDYDLGNYLLNSIICDFWRYPRSYAAMLVVCSVLPALVAISRFLLAAGSFGANSEITRNGGSKAIIGAFLGFINLAASVATLYLYYVWLKTPVSGSS